jgi:hypothetical protein
MHLCGQPAKIAIPHLEQYSLTVSFFLPGAGTILIGVILLEIHSGTIFALYATALLFLIYSNQLCTL